MECMEYILHTLINQAGIEQYAAMKKLIALENIPIVDIKKILTDKDPPPDPHSPTHIVARLFIHAP